MYRARHLRLGRDVAVKIRLRHAGHYEKLWRHQSGGFIANELDGESLGETGGRRRQSIEVR